MDASKGTRYTWDDIKQECICPVCACQADDIQKIALGIAQMNRHKSLFTNTNELSKEAALQTFLRQQVQAGMCVVDRVARDIPEETDKEDRSILLQQTLMEGTASGLGNGKKCFPSACQFSSIVSTAIWYINNCQTTKWSSHRHNCSRCK
jgi:hypothetical protein